MINRLRRILFQFSFLSYFISNATTTSITTRQVNVSDGVVIPGAINGSNTNQWETDEKLQGFNGIIDWYLTWDDNNLYIGKIGGNNTQGSIIYVRADFNGAVFTDTAQTYDGFSPNLNLMSGINFVAYFKEGYSEYRNYSGTWSDTNTTLTPSFSNQSGTEHCEISIPWGAITNGNGKPYNLRAVFYQIDNNSAICTTQNPNPFLYAESPWGTGAGNNGPNISVNDGTPTSAVQPNACLDSNAIITRWWGCYPIIGGVGTNEFVASLPDAGADINICSTQSSVILQANEPTAEANGIWSLIESPAGAVPQIVNPNNKNTVVSDLTLPGEYIFVWNINYGFCSVIPDTMKVLVWENLPAANAGTDQLLSCGATAATFSGNAIATASNFSGGIGSWIAVNNSSVIDNQNSEVSNISNIPFGINKFVWKVENFGCIATTDTVVITNFAPVNVSVVPQQNVCGNSVQLNANDPSDIQNTAIGQWLQLSGPSTAFVTSQNSHNAQLLSLQNGTYTFQWKVSNGNCVSDSAQTQLDVYPIIDAGLGNVQQLCNQTAVQLQGADPASIHSSIIGVWSVIAGNGITFQNNQNFNTIALGLDTGIFSFQWKLSNGICADDSAIYVFRNFAQPIALAGKDTTLCINTIQLYANNPQQIQFSATGNWSVVSGGNATFSNAGSFNSVISNLSYGSYNLQWVVSNGTCIADTDNVTITVGSLVAANAGSNINLCNSNSVTLNATNTVNATSLWSSNAASVIFSDASSNTTNVTGLGFGTTIFKWKLTGTCNTDSSSVTVINYKQPTSNAGNDKIICNNTIQLAANNPFDIAGSATGLWQELSGPSTLVFSSKTISSSTIGSLVAGDYTLQWSVSNGVCVSASSVINIKVKSGVSFGNIIIENTDFDAHNGAIVLENPTAGANQYQYSLNNASFVNDTIFKSLYVGKNYLIIKDNAGCTADTILEIKPNFFIPTGFSPNGDGVNDTWQILNIESFPDAEIKVYTIWGEIIFETIGNQKIFDATFNGNPLPDGNYYYIVDLRNGTQAKKGKITILR